MTAASPTAAQVLRDARAVIADPAHWTKGAFARGEHGANLHDGFARDAVCFCALGAVESVTGRDFTRSPSAEMLLNLNVPNGTIADFNDDPATSHADVLAVFDRAIADAEERGL